MKKKWLCIVQVLQSFHQLYGTGFQISMQFEQDNPSGEAGHDLLIGIMQICYSDLNSPVKNFKGQIKHPESMESEREA